MGVIHELPAASAVHLVVGCCHNQVRTLAQRIDDRLAGGNAVGLGRDGLGEYNTVTFGHIASYDRRDQPKVRLFTVM